ncbi:MAG: hypothetical protein H0W62_04740 [Chitinophagales bacterium]|nr:hypothetical protein [Chitinophagales bacterium]
MKNKIIFSTACFSMFFVLSLVSCKKSDKCSAGIGGTITLVAFPQHHGKPVLSHTNYFDTAFVEFNTQQFPGTGASNYDLVIAGEAGEDHVHIPNIKCGDYYLYMSGFDTTLNQRVTGGIPYTIPENSSSEIDVAVPVTE